jgi:hypothetical protein
MKTNPGIRPSYCFCVISLVLVAAGAGAQDAKKAADVTLTITRVRGHEYSVKELEGELKGKMVRYVLFSVDVVLDNQTGDELTVNSNFYSAFDGLRLVLLREGKNVAEQAYIHHQSPFSFDGRPFVLKKGKNQHDLRVPMRLPPEDWAKLDAKVVGDLPGSKFKGKLESNLIRIQRVKDFGPLE